MVEWIIISFLVAGLCLASYLLGVVNESKRWTRVISNDVVEIALARNRSENK